MLFIGYKENLHKAKQSNQNTPKLEPEYQHEKHGVVGHQHRKGAGWGGGQLQEAARGEN